MPVSNVKVAHLVSHPIQYFAPLYRAVAARPEVSLTVYFFSGESLKSYFDTEFGRSIAWDVPLLEGYDSVLFPVAKNRKVSLGFDWRPNWGILKDLWRKKYDVVWLHGYSSLNAWLALAISRFHGSPVLLREEQTLLTARSASKKLVKQILLPLFYRRIAGLYIGKNSRDFFVNYGTKPENLYPARYCVDNTFFGKCLRELKPKRAEIRKRFGIESKDPVILFSGKLIDKKQPGLLLEAFRRIRSNHRCHLLFAGDGPLKNELTAKVASESIPDVHWAGFLNQAELPAAYVAADIFVLPSAYKETWGLVVNEAMNFGLPIVISDHVGCGSDLVREEQNGHIFPSGNVDALAAALERLVASEQDRQRYGLLSKEIVADYSIEACAAQIVHACLAVCGKNESPRTVTPAEEQVKVGLSSTVRY